MHARRIGLVYVCVLLAALPAAGQVGRGAGLYQPPPQLDRVLRQELVGVFAKSDLVALVQPFDTAAGWVCFSVSDVYRGEFNARHEFLWLRDEVAQQAGRLDVQRSAGVLVALKRRADGEWLRMDLPIRLPPVPATRGTGWLRELPEVVAAIPTPTPKPPADYIRTPVPVLRDVTLPDARPPGRPTPTPLEDPAWPKVDRPTPTPIRQSALAAVDNSVRRAMDADAAAQNAGHEKVTDLRAQRQRELERLVAALGRGDASELAAMRDLIAAVDAGRVLAQAMRSELSRGKLARTVVDLKNGGQPWRDLRLHVVPQKSTATLDRIVPLEVRLMNIGTSALKLDVARPGAWVLKQADGAVPPVTVDLKPVPGQPRTLVLNPMAIHSFTLEITAERGPMAGGEPTWQWHSAAGSFAIDSVLAASELWFQDAGTPPVTQATPTARWGGVQFEHTRARPGPALRWAGGRVQSNQFVLRVPGK